MKHECGIIRDLLPLYAENMVSEDTMEQMFRLPGILAAQQQFIRRFRGDGL